MGRYKSKRVDHRRKCCVILATLMKACTAVVERGEEGPRCYPGSELSRTGREHEENSARIIDAMKNKQKKVKTYTLCIYLYIFFSRTSTFQLLDTPWSQVPSPPRFLPSIFIAHRVQQSRCSSIFNECCCLTLSRFRKSICAQQKVPTNLYEYAVGGIRTHELTYSRLEDNLIRHRGDRIYTRG